MGTRISFRLQLFSERGRVAGGRDGKPFRNLLIVSVARILGKPFKARLLYGVNTEMVGIRPPNRNSSAHAFNPCISKRSLCCDFVGRNGRDIILSLGGSRSGDVFVGGLGRTSMLTRGFHPNAVRGLKFS